MASQLQLRRGTTVQHGPFIGAPGEVTVDTDKKTVVVHDGTTAGGFPVLSASGGTMTGPVSMGGSKITNLATPTAATDAASKNYVDVSVATFSFPDGDYGDITVSGGSTVFTIDNDAVTTAKILNANVTAAKLASNAVETAKIADDAVTAAKLDGISSLNTQTDNYTLVLGDAGRVIDMNAATDKTVTVPANASVAFATGATVIVTRRGAGEITVAGASGVTIRSASTTFATVTGAASTDIITATGSAFIAGQVVRFSSITGGTGLSASTDYYVVSPSGATFSLAATSGGTAINLTTDITAGTLLANTKRLGAQNAAAALIKISTDEWLLAGNLKA